MLWLLPTVHDSSSSLLAALLSSGRAPERRVYRLLPVADRFHYVLLGCLPVRHGRCRDWYRLRSTSGPSSQRSRCHRTCSGPDDRRQRLQRRRIEQPKLMSSSPGSGVRVSDITEAFKTPRDCKFDIQTVGLRISRGLWMHARLIVFSTPDFLSPLPLFCLLMAVGLVSLRSDPVVHSNRLDGPRPNAAPPSARNRLAQRAKERTFQAAL